MHDIDRTQREFASALHELQPEQFEYPGEQEVFGETATEGALQEAGLFETGYHEAPSYEGTEIYEGQETGIPEFGSQELPESEEMELAAELLEVNTEEELDRFLGKLFKGVGRFVGKAIGPVGRALGGVLKPLAKVALPIAGKALGTFVGGPVGGMLGGKLASAAGNLFGLELEGLSGEDREFEVARRFVRFANAATRNALAAAPGANPMAVAKAAVASAARTLAPGLRRAAPAPRAYGAPAPRAYGAPAPLAYGAPAPRAYGAPAPLAYGAPAPPAYGAPAPDYSDGNGSSEPIPAGARRRGIWIRRGRRIVLLGV